MAGKGSAVPTTNSLNTPYRAETPLRLLPYQAKMFCIPT